MRKTILLIAILVFGAISVKASLAPLNVQNATINTEDGSNDQLTVGFNWSHDHVRFAPGVHLRTNSFQMPSIDYRHSFDMGLPVRVGMSTALVMGGANAEVGSATAEASAFGFGNMGLSLELGLIQNDTIAITPYINQTFALTHSDLLLANVLRPVSGADAYGFQTGANYRLKLWDDLQWYGDVAYRFDVPETGAVQHSLVYYNEAVWGGDNFGISVGVLGNSVYTDGIGTDLRLVPGIIAPVGDNIQARVGFPIGLTSDSPDFGVQASLYSTF